jgi:regulatory protein YycH of two-component signal transduction system YycFG
LEYNYRAIENLENKQKMKKRLKITAIIMMMNHVLTPFSYALDGGEIFDVEENVAVENEIIEDEEVEDVEEDLEDTENTISESLESDTEQEEIDSLDTDNRET